VKRKYYLTTPLYYVNARPHIGHSYTNIATDTLARWQKLAGHDVLFLTGTDEHGQKIEKAAQEAGQTPQEFTDTISLTFRDLWDKLNVRYDDFIRTTEKRHIDAVQAVWRELEKAGKIHRHVYSGWYCVPDETFYNDGAVLREGGKTLCPDCKRAVERIDEENFFFKMPDSERLWLIGEIESGANMKILPESRKNEVLGFLKNVTLQDLCVSRPKNRLSWGIPCPLSDNHVTYVWFDALVNYISAVGYPDREKLDEAWPADVHVIGKDILRHHAVYWTLILHALGLKLPKLIFAHGWWVQDGEKMSKSRGNVVDPLQVIADYGVDAYRYFLLRETPFGEDGTFSDESLTLRYNTNMANDLGNLLQRTLAMCEKYYGKTFPGYDTESSLDGSAIQKHVNALAARLSPLMDRLAFSEALQEIWTLIAEANKFIEMTAPWKLAKEQKAKELAVALGTLLEALKIVAQAVWSFLPATGEQIWKQLGLPGTPDAEPIAKSSFGYFKNGAAPEKGAALFPRREAPAA